MNGTDRECNTAHKYSVRKTSMDRNDRDRFLATLAHELRNPLAPITNALQIMEMMELNAEVEALREIMARQVERLCYLVDVLADVSRVSDSSLTLTKEVVPLSTIVNRAVETSSAEIEELGHVLNVSLPYSSVFVLADTPRLAQVISSLLQNASKYSESGCRIDLAVRVDDDIVELTVQDQGVGISPEHIDTIFKMFTQIDGNIQRGTPGLGIGLTMAKALVELHAGTLVAESIGIGKGSTFTIRMPLADVPAGSIHVDNTAPDNGHSRSFRVLIVDDMESLRHVMAKLLEKLGHTVEIAKDGAQAIEKLETFLPEIIFSDISMPGMSGYELVQTLRKRLDMKMVYMVAITGSDQEFDRQLALEMGFDEHLTKPVDFMHLRALFASLTMPEHACAD